MDKNNICGTNVLIRAIGAPLGDCILWNFFKKISGKTFKKI